MKGMKKEEKKMIPVPIPEMESLKDPKKNRQVQEVPTPAHQPLSAELLFGPGRKPNWRVLLNHFKREGKLKRESTLELIKQATLIFREEPNVLTLEDPVTVVGDIHGQFYDLVKILEIGGNPESKKYLFLGDYIDRGMFSVETVLTLFAIKVNYPKTTVLLKGNHECRTLAAFFNFKQEVLFKHDEAVFNAFMESFDALPLACVLNDRFLAIHAGISPDVHTLEDIKKIDRFQEPPREGPYCDILWSDPIENDLGICDPKFMFNSVRGCSYYYGKEAVNKFLNDNDLLSVIRGHEAQLDGYKMHKWNGSDQFPCVITVFSAPNYCDAYRNKGAVVKFSDNTLNIQQFVCSPHPYVLPNFMDLFSWSIPFICEKVTEMLFHLMKPKKDSEAVKPEELEKAMSTPDKAQSIRNKIKFMAIMLKMFKTLRVENQNILKLKELTPDQKLPKSVLIQGSAGIKDAIDLFENARKMDAKNERLPEIP